MKKLLVACSALALLIPFQANAQQSSGTEDSSISMPDDSPGKKDSSFERLDQDGDGALSTGEVMSSAHERFSERDTDGNGYLSAEEFQTPLLMETEDAPELDPTLEQRRVSMRQHQFERLDTNGDGLLSRGEVFVDAQDRVERLDTNGDGNVTVGEVDAKIEAAKAKGKAALAAMKSQPPGKSLTTKSQAQPPSEKRGSLSGK